jgi:hypothetical protein
MTKTEKLNAMWFGDEKPAIFSLIKWLFYLFLLFSLILYSVIIVIFIQPVELIVNTILIILSIKEVESE